LEYQSANYREYFDSVLHPQKYAKHTKNLGAICVFYEQKIHLNSPAGAFHSGDS